jgi:hypothetical protein
VTDDLFASFAAELEAEAPAPPPVSIDPNRQPVASYACPCGARDEVLEPAPVTVDCWLCRQVRGMKRWEPNPPPPSGSARKCTPAELARL